MNEVLKQRLVGALILVALGVVFWPIIFVEPGERGGAEEARIPPRPQVDTTPVEPPDMAGLRPSREISREGEGDRQLLTLAPESPSPANTARVETQAKQPVAKTAPPPVASKTSVASKPVADKTPVANKAPAANKKTRTQAPVKPTVDADGIPVVWILRVASVSSAERADELRKRLLAMDQKAYVKKVKSGGKTLYRVYVGPKAEKAKLEKIQGQINAEFGVTTMITRYYP